VSSERDILLFERAKRILDDEMHERVWLMRQLGASFEQIGNAINRTAFTARSKFYRRLDAVQNYRSLESRALRAGYSK
jgi:hypothetical protein